MGISKGTDGRWFVRHKDATGKWRTRAFRSEAEATAYDAVVEQERHEAIRLSFGEVAAAYLRSRTDLHPRTAHTIRCLVADGAASFLLNRFADSLTRQDLERFRENLRVTKLAPVSINRYHSYINAILSWGFDQQLISRHPWRGFKKLPMKRFVVNPSLDDFKSVMDHLAPHWQWAFKTCFNLSLRPGEVELLTLTWDAFNWTTRSVTVQQGKHTGLKTVFPSDGYLAEAEGRYADDKARGITWVIHKDGKRLRSYRNAWLNACKASGVSMRPYDIRHLSATIPLSMGADLAAVQRQLGHASAATTGQFYAHAIAGAQHRAGQMLPEL